MSITTVNEWPPETKRREPTSDSCLDLDLDQDEFFKDDWKSDLAELICPQQILVEPFGDTLHSILTLVGQPGIYTVFLPPSNSDNIA